MKSPEALLRETESVLQKAYLDFKRPQTAPLAAEFYELRLQAAIFQFDICNEIVPLWQFEPKGFALQVALKDIVHKLYEYDLALCRRLIGRVLALATSRGLEVDRKYFKTERASWRKELDRLARWSAVRNASGGHYGANIREQARLIEELQRDEVMEVAISFMRFNGTVINALRDIGRGAQ